MPVHVLASVLAASKPSSGGGNPTLLIFIAIAAAFYFLIYRPQQRKSKAAREASNKFEIGDQVLTAGGLVGHVLDIDGDRVTLETSVGASFVVLKQYVLRKIEQPEPDDEPEADEHEYDEHEYDEHQPEDETEALGEGDHAAADEETGGQHGDGQEGVEHGAAGDDASPKPGQGSGGGSAGSGPGSRPAGRRRRRGRPASGGQGPTEGS
jgi:preprotein translocase subunit YajC